MMKIVTATRYAAGAAWTAFKSVFTLASAAASYYWQGLTAAWGAVTYTALARRAYRNPTAARALRLVSQLMASIPFAVEEDGEMTDEHDMLRLVNRPNARTSRGLLMDQLVAHLYCAGEVFIRRIAPETGPNRGRPTAAGGSITLLSPERFQEFVRERGTDEIIGYRFSDRLGRTVTYTLEEVLHIRIYNPWDEDRGLPLLLAASRALEQQEAADDWNKSLSSGGGRVPGVLSPVLEDGKQLTPEQVARAQESADESFGAAQRESKAIVLSGAFKYTPNAMTLRDADFLQAGKENARRIAAVVGVPATLLGDEKGGNLTDSGVDSEVRATYLLTVLPLTDFVLDELNNWLSPYYDGARLTYDRDQIEALQEDVNALYERMVKAVGGPFLTVNEARESQGYDKLVGEQFDTIGFSAPVPARTAAAPEGDPAPMRSLDMGGVRAAIRAHFQQAA